MADDTGTPAVENKVEDNEPTYVTKKDLDTFGENLVQKMGSYYGRISKEQVNKSFDEKVDPAKMEEQLSTQLFGGDVSGTVNKILDKREAETKRLRGEKLTEVETEMENYKDQPFFDDIKDVAKKIAEEALGNGFPPGPAVELGIEKAKNKFLINRDPDLKLSMSGPGKQISRQTKAPKMPAALKAAAERDIKDGYYKDEAAYLAELSPQIKAKYDL